MDKTLRGKENLVIICASGFQMYLIIYLTITKSFEYTSLLSVLLINYVHV